MDATIAIAAGSLLISAASLAFAIVASRRTTDKESEARLRKIEAELLTVDQRIMVACHARVKRMPEFGDFKARVEDFMEEVNRSGVLK